MRTELDEQKGFWIVSAPARPGTDNPLAAQQAATRDTANCWGFRVPMNLRVGTLDALMSLSDDLSKMDMFFENTATKIARLFYDLTAGAKDAPLSVNGSAVDAYMTNFRWEESRYPVKNSLRELVEQMSSEVSKLDEELRVKSGEYNQQVQQLASENRKKSGNLLLRSLHDIVKPADVTESENLTTLIVAVPKFYQKEWDNSYEKLVDYVVPRSSKVLVEDAEHALVTVVLFKRMADEFKNKARDKRFTVRDFRYDAAEAAAADAERKRLEQGVEDKKIRLIRWTKTNFSEAFVASVHLKAVRVFVESVLRYGLPVNFQAILVQPKKGNAKKLRRQLYDLYKNLEGKSATAGGDEDDLEEYFPYVSLRVGCEFGAPS